MSAASSGFSEIEHFTEDEVRAAQASVRQLARILESADTEFHFRLNPGAETEETMTLPRSAVHLLKDILAAMARGQGPNSRPLDLSVEDAAEFLNVSQPYLLRLLEEPRIPSRLVGEHRFVRLDDLLKYKRQHEAERLKVLDELVAQAQELGMGY
ncbi:MAG: helix-turn-helix domain-containing protein [Isosphaeraceae bacterium]